MGDNMYNAERKAQFIDWYVENCKGVRGSINSILSRIGEQELKIGKDVCDFSKEDALNAMGASFDDYDVANGALNVLRAYARWLGYAGQNSGFLAMSLPEIDLSEQLAPVVIKSPEHLYEEIMKVRQYDDGYPEPVVLFLAWLGLGWQDILSVQDDCVDLNSGIICSATGEVLAENITGIPLDVLSRYRNCKSSFRDNRTGSYPVIKDMTTSYFMRKFQSPNSKKFGTVYTRGQLTAATSVVATRYQELTGVNRLTVHNAIRSGGFYRLRQLEESGVDVFATKNKALVLQAYRAPKNYYSLKRMYAFYKKAFNL